MPSVYDRLPEEVAANLKELVVDLDAHIPLKVVDRNLLIATWNIRAFGDLTRKWESEKGDSPKRDLHAVFCIAEILKRFDVIAVQEVKSNIRALRDTLKVLGDHWSFVLTDVCKGASGNSERMAYIFDTRRVKMSGLACELVVPNEWSKGVSDHALEEQFVRTPYAVSFTTGRRTFILVTLHIKYGKKSKDRVKELKCIAEWLADWAGDINAYNHNLIVLGDFNIDKRGDLLDDTFLSEGLYVPDDLQDPAVTRSIFNKTKYYDHIAWFNDSNKVPNLSLTYKKGGNYDFVPVALKNRELTNHSLSWQLSDHYPLWVEFEA